MLSDPCQNTNSFIIFGDPSRHYWRDAYLVITVAGTPPANAKDGTACPTTLPEAMTQPRPSRTPLRIVQLAPMRTSSSIMVGAVSPTLGAASRESGDGGWKSVSITIEFAPIDTLSPISISVSAQIVPPVIAKSSPIVIRAPGRRVLRTTGWLGERGLERMEDRSDILRPMEMTLDRCRWIIGRP